MMQILMVEDNRSVSEMMSLFFQKEEWDADYAYDGISAVKMFKEHPDEYDIVILDLNLPGMDGIQVNSEIRAVSPTIPVIIVTARDSESDEVLGFKVGADDYVTKPFSPLALIQRIKAVVRRAQLARSQGTNPKNNFDVVVGPHFKLNSVTHEVRWDDTPIDDLTRKEFEVLKVMAESPEQVFTRTQLLQQIWGYEFVGDERTVDSHIRKIRRKLAVAHQQLIHTVWGVGYKFSVEDDG